MILKINKNKKIDAKIDTNTKENLWGQRVVPSFKCTMRTLRRMEEHAKQKVPRGYCCGMPSAWLANTNASMHTKALVENAHVIACLLNFVVSTFFNGKIICCSPRLLMNKGFSNTRSFLSKFHKLKFLLLINLHLLIYQDLLLIL